MGGGVDGGGNRQIHRGRGCPGVRAGADLRTGAWHTYRFEPLPWQHSHNRLWGISRQDLRMRVCCLMHKDHTLAANDCVALLEIIRASVLPISPAPSKLFASSTSSRLGLCVCARARACVCVRACVRACACVWTCRSSALPAARAASSLRGNRPGRPRAARQRLSGPSGSSDACGGCSARRGERSARRGKGEREEGREEERERERGERERELRCRGRRRGSPPGSTGSASRASATFSSRGMHPPPLPPSPPPSRPTLLFLCSAILAALWTQSRAAPAE